MLLVKQENQSSSSNSSLSNFPRNETNLATSSSPYGPSAIDYGHPYWSLSARSSYAPLWKKNPSFFFVFLSVWISTIENKFLSNNDSIWSVRSKTLNTIIKHDPLCVAARGRGRKNNYHLISIQLFTWSLEWRGANLLNERKKFSFFFLFLSMEIKKRHLLDWWWLWWCATYYKLSVSISANGCCSFPRWTVIRTRQILLLPLVGRRFYN